MIDRPGFEDKVYYVWFDAPIEYLGATAEWADAGEGRDWRSWWYDADDVEYTQFMAKDNVPFHTVSFPVTLIGSREPWTKAHQIKGFNWLTYYGGKFSTSQGRGVFMDQALDTYPADHWRWFLFANAPESSDSSFTWEQFAVAVNKDLADSFGNLVNRCLTLSAKHYGPVVPAGGEPGEREAQLASDLAEVVAAYTELMDAKELRKSANELRRGWSLANAYWEQSEPWKVVKADPDAAAVIFRTVINVVRVLAVLASPIIPTSSATVLEALGAGDSHLAERRPTSTPSWPRSPPATRWRCQPCCSPRSPTTSWPRWPVRFGGAGLADAHQLPPPPPPPPPPTEPPPPPPPPLDDGAVEADAVELAEHRRHVDVAEAGVLRDRGRTGHRSLPAVDLVEGHGPGRVLAQDAALGGLLGVERLRLVEEAAERLHPQPQARPVRRAHAELPASQQRGEPAAAQERADDHDHEPRPDPTGSPRTRRRTRAPRRPASPGRRAPGRRSCGGRRGGPTGRW